MRLYGMYYTCKMYLETVQNMEIGSKVITAGPVKYIEGWNEKSIILNELAKITPLRESVQKLYESIPIMYRDVAMQVLKKVDGISFCELTSKDVVRHPLVQNIREKDLEKTLNYLKEDLADFCG